MYDLIVINVDELWLKGKNRKDYFKQLRRHISRVLSRYHDHKWQLVNEQQRLVVNSEVAFNDELIERLLKVPGIYSLQPSLKTELDLDKAIELLISKFKDLEAKTFKIQAKRADKSFPKNSMEINRYFGGALLKNTNLKVDVHNPDFLINVRIHSTHIYLSWEKMIAIGGLPVGSSGHAVTLISGGFDSPVASYLMAKRGVSQTLAFFHAYPYVGEEVLEKIYDISKVLSLYQNGMELYIIPFGEIQNEIAKSCDEDYRTLFFRLFMMKVSSKLARKKRAESLIMGDCLAQVSSQTMTNMSVLDRHSEDLVLRPLLGHNKREIIDLSRVVGTHDISIVPHDDACSLFAPKHPVIRAKNYFVEKFLKNNNLDELIDKAIEDAKIIRFDVAGCEQKTHS